MEFTDHGYGDVPMRRSQLPVNLVTQEEVCVDTDACGAPDWWREYWLARCEGFRVRRSGETLGYVEAVEWSGGEETASLMLELCGDVVLHARVAVADVVEIEPHGWVLSLDPYANPVLPARPPVVLA
jgi:hypothetical protein